MGQVKLYGTDHVNFGNSQIIQHFKHQNLQSDWIFCVCSWAQVKEE